LAGVTSNLNINSYALIAASSQFSKDILTQYRKAVIDGCFFITMSYGIFASITEKFIFIHSKN